ncbi:hypothetical protein CTI14_42265 [Methylobacterium radiotolerans]|nr:hypothetical protein CTI14_42265 [Methylobacterium radiotolerans]
MVHNSRYNRRFTSATPMKLAGPVGGTDWVKTPYSPAGTMVRGTNNNCGNGFTCWRSTTNTSTRARCTRTATNVAGVRPIEEIRKEINAHGVAILHVRLENGRGTSFTIRATTAASRRPRR